MADAVRVLTEAARLTRPVLERDDAASQAAGRPVWVESGRREPADWAEFVTLALAGAAANIGSIEGVLAGRPGSWEADGVRQLLISTVGEDEEYLLEHRTEPVVIDLYIDEILTECDVWRAYDAADAVLIDREMALPHDAPEAEFDAVAEATERLEQQERAQYGAALKANVEAAAARRQGLRVPVVVNVDLETFRYVADQGSDYGLVWQIVIEAREATPSKHSRIRLQAPEAGH
jgi:hypothetical protein